MPSVYLIEYRNNKPSTSVTILQRPPSQPVSFDWYKTWCRRITYRILQTTIRQFQISSHHHDGSHTRNQRQEELSLVEPGQQKSRACATTSIIGRALTHAAKCMHMLLFPQSANQSFALGLVFRGMPSNFEFVSPGDGDWWLVTCPSCQPTYTTVDNNYKGFMYVHDALLLFYTWFRLYLEGLSMCSRYYKHP